MDDPIGPYKILRELGRGGMGCVYLAEQEGEGFRRQVALKVVEPGGLRPDVERRFRDERRILAGLEHPGIARFYDAGRAPDGRWFLALEYVEGLNLLDHARQNNLATEEKGRLVLEVLEAVEFAHRHRVVHRDLKPGNILVGSDGRPRLLDFGIAKLIDGEPDDAVTQTRTELRALTPAYASPEQFQGDPVTPASDVFSLGVVLYELLAGVRPFVATSSSRADLERAVLTEEPDPPSTASRRSGTAHGGLPARLVLPFRARGGTVGRDLDAICLKALRKDPGERYPTAASFAQDLRACLEGRPVTARAGSRRYRMVRFARRHRGRMLTTATLAVAAAAVVVAATAYRRAERASSPPAPRVFPIQGLETTPFAEVERRFAAAPQSAEAGAAFALSLTLRGRTQEAQSVVAGLRQIPGREQDPLLDYAEARSYEDDEPQRSLVLLTRARERALAGGRGELIGEIRARRARLLSKMGDRAAARAEMELARADFERAGDRRALLPLLNHLAIEYLNQGRMAEGEALLERVLAEVSARGGQAGNTIRLNLALLARQRGRPDLAEPRQRQVMEQRRAAAAPGASLGEVMHDLAETLHDLGRSREADPLLDEAIALLRKAGPQPSLVETLFSRGLIDVDRARLDRIAETVREMETAARAAGAKVPLALEHDLQGRAAAARGDLASARRHLSEGSRLLVDNGDLDRASETDLAWAAVEHAAGDPAMALRLADGAQARLGNRGAGLPVAFFNAALHASIDAESGRVAEARRRLAAWGDGSANSPSVKRRVAFLGARAALARAEGRFDDARRDLEAARAAADQADRKLDSLSLRLDLAELEARAGDREGAAAARTIAAEAAALGLNGLAARARAQAAVRRSSR
jgi:predicted Ser/Thr protein kinase